MAVSRRQLLSLALAAAVLPAQRGAASPLGLPIGIQLSTLSDELGRDFEGTLHRLAAIGYQEVEFTGFMGRTPAALRTVLAKEGLRCRSAHYSIEQLERGLEREIAFAGELGLFDMVIAAPRLANPVTLDSWKSHADFLNEVGERTKKAGLQLGFHNHNLEFRTYAGVTAFDEMIRLTDPALVKFQLDCGWAVSAGADPAHYLIAHPGRFASLHVKDVPASLARNTNMHIETVAIGKGAVDWAPIFRAAGNAGVTGYFVEAEPRGADETFEAVKISHDYLRKLDV